MMEQFVGKDIDKYRIESELGKGGAGYVYKALDRHLNRPVAIKIIRPNLLDNENFKDRFLQEAQTAANLDHPSIINIYSYDQHDEWLYMVMEYLPEGSLATYLKQTKADKEKTDLGIVLHFIAQISDALDYAAHAGIIHRDIKTDNILIKKLHKPIRPEEPPLRAILTDFGLAKLSESKIRTDSRLLMGTLPYISPELLQGQPPSLQSDLYALGVVLYECVTGQMPFNVRTLEAAVQRVPKDPPIRPRTIRGDVTDELETIVLKLLEKEPARRYLSSEELARDLRQAIMNLNQDNWETFVEVQPPAVTPEPEPEPKPEPAAPVQLTTPTPPVPTPVAEIFINGHGENDRVFRLGDDRITIGRSSNNDLTLAEDSVSSRHALLENSADGWYVTDVGSTNGTVLNHELIAKHVAQRWDSGAPLKIGPYVLTWQPKSVVEHPEPPQSAKSMQVVPVVTSSAESSRVDVLPTESQQVEVPQIGSIALAPITFSTMPGQAHTVTVTIDNDTPIVDHFNLQIEGIPPSWVQFQSTQVHMMANQSTQFQFKIVPPVQQAAAKTYPYRLILSSVSHQGLEGHAFGHVMVQPQPQFQLGIAPKIIKNQGTCQVRIRNSGNVETAVHITAQDSEDSIRFTPMHSHVTVPMGDEMSVPVELGVVKRPFVGNKSGKGFEFTAIPAAGSPQSQKGQLEITPMFPRWLPPVVLALIVGLVGLLVAQLGKVETLESAAFATATAVQATEVAIADSDGDGLPNWKEEEISSNPLDPDTDNDGLKDGQEITIFDVEPLQTKWDLFDTDGDGLLDGEEYASNPNPPEGCEKARGQFTRAYEYDTDKDGENDCIDPDSGALPTPTPIPPNNSLINPSFEMGTKAFQRIDQGAGKTELQVPSGWNLLVDDNVPVEDDSTDKLFVYPEMVPVKPDQLNECNNGNFEPICEIFDGQQGLKVFKGGLPIRFALLQKPFLEPGAYRLTVTYFADTVAYYEGDEKMWGDPGTAEIQLCINLANYSHMDWESVTIGKIESKSLDFIITEANNYSIFVKFRNTEKYNNNGWFFDNWILQKTQEYNDELANQTESLSDNHGCRADMSAAFTDEQ
ncbi:MAG: protein kinase [Anaerolineales bacterium]|nr:protein kinase [Anaerolineales bacterium]